MILIKFIDNCIDGYEICLLKGNHHKEGPGKWPGLLAYLYLYNICTGFTEESDFQDFHEFFQGRTEMDRGKVFLFDESKV